MVLNVSPSQKYSHSGDAGNQGRQQESEVDSKYVEKERRCVVMNGFSIKYLQRMLLRNRGNYNGGGRGLKVSPHVL